MMSQGVEHEPNNNERGPETPGVMQRVKKLMSEFSSKFRRAADDFESKEGKSVALEALPPCVLAKVQENKNFYISGDVDGLLKIHSKRKVDQPEGKEGIQRFVIMGEIHIHADHHFVGADAVRWEYDVDEASGRLLSKRMRRRKQHSRKNFLDSRSTYTPVSEDAVIDPVIQAIRAEPKILDANTMQIVRIEEASHVKSISSLPKYDQPREHIEGVVYVNPPLTVKGKFLYGSQEYKLQQERIPFTIRNGKVSLRLREVSYEEQALFQLGTQRGLKNLGEDQPGSVAIDPDEDRLGPEDPELPEDKKW
jgi:hypothetical protein